MRALLDIEKSAQRTIKSGLQYDNLFPPANLLDKIRHSDGNVKDTVKAMQEVVLKYLDDTRLIAPKLKGATLKETLNNVWKFLYSHCQYRLDEKGLEQLRRPARAWHDRVHGIDCDCFSIFISSILTNLDIPHSFRIAKYLNEYGQPGDWQHVYVIVPKQTGGHYTLDCVAHHFDYEKPPKDKIDYTMTQLNGIPIAILSGFGNSSDDELYGILTGIDFAEVELLEGLGKIPSDQQELTAIYNHLLRTRDYILKNPQSVITSGGAKANLDMLNYAIDNWNTSNRDKALELLEKEEERWNEHNGVSGLDAGDDDDEINGLGAAKKTKKKFWSNVKNVTKKVGKGLKKVGKALVRYNPLTLAVRGGFLLAMKINLLGMAKQIYPGYLTEAEAKGKGVNHDTWQKAQNVIPKINHIFVNVLQGKADKLKKAIMNGRAAKQFHGFGELGEPATIATVLTAVTPLVAAYAAIKKAGLNSEADKSVQGFGDMDELEGLGDTEDATSAAAKQGFIQLIKNWWKKTMGSEKAIAPETITDEDKEPSENSAEAKSASHDIIKAGEKEGDNSGDNESKFMQFIKANPVPAAIGGVAIVTGIALLVRHAMKQPKKTQASVALSGYRKKRKRKRSKPAHKKMKTLILK
jgi:hypothetical protein